MKFLSFLALLVIGFISIYYSKPLVDNTGRLDWLEEHFGPGTTYMAVKIIGLGIIVYGFYYLAK